MLRYFVKIFFKYKKFSYSEILEVTCYVICLFRFLWKPSMMTFTCLYKSMNVWNMHEICEIWMKTNVLNKLLWVSDVVLLIFLTSEVYSLELHIYDVAFLQKYCKYMCNILYTQCLWLYLYNFKCVIFKTTQSNMHLWWSFFAKIA